MGKSKTLRKMTGEERYNGCILGWNSGEEARRTPKEDGSSRELQAFDTQKKNGLRYFGNIEKRGLVGLTTPLA